MRQAAAAALTLPGATAAYYRDGAGFRLHGTNPMTKAEGKWWRKHGQDIVDTLARPTARPGGADARRGDPRAYAITAATESVQRVPMVFWSRAGRRQRAASRSARST
jgi:hypothetical protein